ncbi:hypothetical protein GCM10010260_29940 [Streptomyces filipinensis]|uniref:Uncharacterized protein n=1 Tax=Streptomyces filipinensis TaxID=66887 RepID=A0A918MBL8_9ACTN|nr:hypothetical protein GCM10010260_29940 [Streptomyces filipinensis]
MGGLRVEGVEGDHRAVQVERGKQAEVVAGRSGVPVVVVRNTWPGLMEGDELRMG